MNKAILIQADDWEGLYVNGKLVEEGHSLNEGNNKIKYFKKLSQQYAFDMSELSVLYIDESDEEQLDACGNFPDNLNELNGKYN